MDPNPPPELLERLKQRFDFGAWRNRNRLAETLFVKNFSLFGGELPGWQPQRIQPIRLSPWPPACRAIWRPASLAAGPLVRTAGAAGPVVHLDVFECPSRARAHEFLLHLLAEFQLAGIARLDDAQAGDVFFGHPSAQAAVFARGNLAVLLRNTAPIPASVAELTLAFDRSIVRLPEPSALLAAGAGPLPQETAAPLAVGSRAPLPLDPRFDPGAVREARFPVLSTAAGPPSPPPMLKIFASAGEVSSEADRLYYDATVPGEHTVTFVEVSAGGTAAVRRMRFFAT